MLSRLPRQTDPNVLVGFDTSDDAGVYRLTGDTALVQTVDFLTPIADDPFTYGQIAAANSLSDVYAMGGRPVSALSIVGFPPKADADLMEQILRGGLDKMNEAGCAVIGGHSVRDEELKFGYAVTGVINPQRIWRNVGAQAGDVLILTKPLGTGVIATALKSGRAAPGAVEAAVASMARLNRDAAEALLALDGSARAIHAVTDVTGFGLLGHAREMGVASGVSLRIDSSQIEFLEGAREAAQAGHLAGGLKANREFLGECIQFRAAISSDIQNLLFDPQTSGGLLVAISPDRANFAQQALARHHCRGVVIGEVVPKTSPLIIVS